MTNQVAITMLKNLEQSLDDYCELNDEGKTAFSMAITALELFGNSEQLPFVQPRKGKWILDNPRSDNSLIYIYACSECHAHHRARYDFCPSCGADMRSEAREYLEYGKLIAKGIAQGLRGDAE